MTGVRLGVGLAFVLIAIAEMLGANEGLGHLIWNSWQVFRAESVYVGLVTKRKS